MLIAAHALAACRTETIWLHKPQTGAYVTDFLANSPAIAEKIGIAVLGRRLFRYSRSSPTGC